MFFAIFAALGVYQTYQALGSSPNAYGLVAALPILAFAVGICGVFWVTARAFTSAEPAHRSRAAAANIALLIAGALMGLGFAFVSRNMMGAATALFIVGLPAIVNLNQLLRK
ncbi:MAG: hypothetical protein IH627_08975 [Rubrivivax sp.]|nr:hypothetical protein [Rubrivivax sp.]